MLLTFAAIGAAAKFINMTTGHYGSVAYNCLIWFIIFAAVRFTLSRFLQE